MPHGLQRWRELRHRGVGLKQWLLGFAAIMGLRDSTLQLYPTGNDSDDDLGDIINNVAGTGGPHHELEPALRSKYERWCHRGIRAFVGFHTVGWWGTLIRLDSRKICL